MNDMNKKLQDIFTYINFRIMDDKNKVLSEKIKVWVPELVANSYRTTMRFGLNNETKQKINKRQL